MSSLPPILITAIVIKEIPYFYGATPGGIQIQVHPADFPGMTLEEVEKAWCVGGISHGLGLTEFRLSGLESPAVTNLMAWLFRDHPDIRWFAEAAP